MSTPFVSRITVPTPDSRATGRDAGHDNHVNVPQPRLSSTLLAPLWEEETHSWTRDQSMLNNEIQFLVDQASRLPHIEWADLEARITKAVEDRPSLYREEECEAGNAQVSFGARQARTQNNVKSPSDDSRGSSFDGSYGTADPEEAKTQKRAQQKAYSRRITTLRNIVTENHGKLINGQDLTQYKIPAENLSMEGHYGEKYTRLADAYNSQILLRERLSALGNVNDRKAIIDEVKKWDVRNDELYVKQVTSSHQQVNERSKQQTVRRPSVRNPFGLAPANASESPLTAQRASHPAPTFNLPSFERTSDVPNTSRAGRAPADGYPGSPRSIARTTADQAKNTNPLARLPSNPAGDYTIPALGAATSVSGIAKMKRIRIRLRLPEDDKSASRYMFWSQPLSRDEFFRQVSERFPNHSVQFVETVLDSDGILVEPTGSEDEWEIMQEELSRILEQSLTEKLQVDVVVHLG